jgi:hypothetical protein
VAVADARLLVPRVGREELGPTCCCAPSSSVPAPHGCVRGRARRVRVLRAGERVAEALAGPTAARRSAAGSGTVIEPRVRARGVSAPRRRAADAERSAGGSPARLPRPAHAGRSPAPPAFDATSTRSRGPTRRRSSGRRHARTALAHRVDRLGAGLVAAEKRRAVGRRARPSRSRARGAAPPRVAAGTRAHAVHSSPATDPARRRMLAGGAPTRGPRSSRAARRVRAADRRARRRGPPRRPARPPAAPLRVDRRRRRAAARRRRRPGRRPPRRGRSRALEHPAGRGRRSSAGILASRVLGFVRTGCSTAPSARARRPTRSTPRCASRTSS